MTSLIALDGIDAAGHEAWARLAARAAEANPFFEPIFASAASRTLGSSGVSLLVVAEGDDWLGCVPVQVRGTLGFTLFASTWKHSYSYLGTPLVDRDRVDQFATALVAGLRQGRPASTLLLRRCADGPVLAAIRAAAAEGGLAPLFERSYERGTYRREADREPLSWIKSKRLSELKRQRRKLGEELGDEIVIADCSDYSTAAEEFLELESSGWKGEGGTALASSAGSTEFFRALCEEFGRHDRLRLRTLRAGERNLAMTCDIGGGTELFGFKAAYDESLRRYSPGIQLQADNFAHFDSERPETLFDSCAEGGNEAVNSLWPDRRQIVTVAFGRAGARAAVLSRVLDAAYETRSRRAERKQGSGSPSR